MKLEVEITQEDIDNGIKGNCFNCPNSLAIQRALLNNEDFGPVHVSTTAQMTSFLDLNTDEVYGFVNPRELKLFVLVFDAGVNPKPFKYSTELVHDDPKQDTQENT